jgi:hypothetical protein
MSHSCLDPDHEHPSNPTLDMLADPFRRRLLSAAVLAAIGCALLVAGIPFPAQAAGAGVATAPQAPLVITQPAGKPLAT